MASQDVFHPDAVYAALFDASALVKVQIYENGSDAVRRYFNNQPNKYTTPPCFFEALGVLKAMRFTRKHRISHETYETATFNLMAWYAASSDTLPDIKLTDPQVFRQVQEMSRKHSVDLSDAFQLLSLKAGYFSPMTGGSQTLLVAADSGLAEAARVEGLRVWDVLKEPRPPAY
jgi:hypothetical protein